MCGRFTIISDPVAYQLEFDIELDNTIKQNWKARYNVSPSQSIPVFQNSPERSIRMMQWGLIPIWAAKSKKKFNLINVRSETIRDKPYFKKLVEQGKRCLIFADGFYEWQSPVSKGMPKVPYYFQLKNSKPFAFAGIWETSTSPENQTVNTCAIITCPPNPLVEPVHNRMPVVLDPAAGREWMGQQSTSDLLSMLKPYPAKSMQAFAVSRLVNSPNNDMPENILPASQ